MTLVSVGRVQDQANPHVLTPLSIRAYACQETTKQQHFFTSYTQGGSVLVT